MDNLEIQPDQETRRQRLLDAFDGLSEAAQFTVLGCAYLMVQSDRHKAAQRAAAIREGRSSMRLVVDNG